MALKRNSSYAAPDDISHYCATAAERGGVASFVHGGSSFTSNLDDPDNVIEYPATLAPTTGNTPTVPVGVLMMTVLDYDPTQVERNFQNPYEVVVGSKVWVKRGGFVETDMIDPDYLASVKPGPAYLGMSGLLTTVDTGYKVGRFESYADSEGYVKFYINVNR